MRFLIALKIIVRFIVGVIFTPVALRGIRRDVHRMVAPGPPARKDDAVPPAPSTQTIQAGVLEDANRQGVKLQGQPRWIDYGRTFQGEPVSNADIGKPVELVLVHARSGSYIRRV